MYSSRSRSKRQKMNLPWQSIDYVHSKGMTMKSKHIGSDLDELLDEDGVREEVVAAAIKRVLAWQLAKAMEKKQISKTDMAARMNTSRAAINRLLDASDTSVTLATLARASVAVGVPLKVRFGKSAVKA
jgi:pyrroloquinoline quinone (PQQ) biosynthesis protein C